MSRSTSFDSVHAVAARLPFHLDDTAQANQAFSRWVAQGREEDGRIVALWTYCFVRRYFLVKFMQMPVQQASDFDLVIEKAYRAVERHRGSVQNPNAYASWVSVVCKNTFLNYCRVRRVLVPADEPFGSTLVAEPEPSQHQIGVLYQVLIAAIARLPGFIREVARLRFVENCSYEEIARIVEKPLPTVRTYVNKALTRFREDPELMTYLEDLKDAFLDR